MTTHTFPEKPTLRQCKIQAKELLKAVHRRDKNAAARLRHHHPEFARSGPNRRRLKGARLNDVQLVVAREYGFDSWPRLKACVEGRFHSRLLHFLMAAGITHGKRVMTEAERLQFAETLVRHGAALDPRDGLLQSTPLGWACRWGRQEVAAFLLEAGAPAREPGAEPWATPLAWAEKRGHQDIAEMLRGHGAIV